MVTVKTVEIIAHELVRKASQEYPKYGDSKTRVSFKDSTWAPVMHIYLRFKDKVLLVKRSDKVRKYKNTWGCIGGYIDEIVPLKDKVMEELEEELNISKSIVSKIRFAHYIKYEDINEDMVWYIHPILVELKSLPEIKLDWEATDYAWVTFEDMKKYNVFPNVIEAYTLVK